MPVQDDERERELVRLFNLTWDPAHQRAGVDAELELKVDGKSYRMEVEVKSSTGQSVSTARDVGMEHIRKWRSKLFVVGFYSKAVGRPELLKSLCLTPTDMEPWIAEIEAKIQIDFKLAALAPQRLNLADLFDVCGFQDTYSINDAKALHRKQWTTGDYAAAPDVKVKRQRRISQDRMLEILKLRSKYIAERGATLNNPHITKKLLEKFDGTSREVVGSNWALTIKAVATEFITQNPDHLAVRLI